MAGKFFGSEDPIGRVDGHVAGEAEAGIASLAVGAARGAPVGGGDPLGERGELA